MKILSYFFALTLLSAVAVHAESVFKFVELKETSSFTIPENSKKEKSVGGSVGGRLVLGKKQFSLDARNYVTLPKTTFSALDEVSSAKDFFTLWNDMRYGIGATANTKFSVGAKAGMLSFSKSVSRLKNPAPSASANPLAKSFGFSAGIGANLPTLSSAIKPLALFAQVSAPQKQVGFPFAAQVAYDADDTALASVSVTVPFSKFVSLQTVATAGHFLVQADNTTKKLLADTNAFFDEAWVYAASIESAFRSPFAKANLFVGFHQTPFSAEFTPYAVWIKAAVRTSWRNILLDLSYFSIPTLSASPRPVPLIGGSSTVCRTISQFGINPQVQFDVYNAYAATIRLGFHSLIEKKILNTQAAEQYSTLKWSVGVAYESKPFTAKLTAGATNHVLDGRFLTTSTTPDEYYSFDLSSSFVLELVRASVSFGYDRYPKSAKTGNTKDSFSVDVSASPGKARILTLTTGASSAYKNGEQTSGSANASATVKLKGKWVRATVKCAVTVPIDPKR